MCGQDNQKNRLVRAVLGIVEAMVPDGEGVRQAKQRTGVALRMREQLAAALLSALALAGGCARVAPYERETLARRDMELSGKAALRAGEEHAQAYREGSSGGGDAKGGGCGCN